MRKKKRVKLPSSGAPEQYAPSIAAGKSAKRVAKPNVNLITETDNYAWGEGTHLRRYLTIHFPLHILCSIQSSSNSGYFAIFLRKRPLHEGYWF